jgi:hypothetical protein
LRFYTNNDSHHDNHEEHDRRHNTRDSYGVHGVSAPVRGCACHGGVVF